MMIMATTTSLDPDSEVDSLVELVVPVVVVVVAVEGFGTPVKGSETSAPAVAGPAKASVAATPRQAKTLAMA
jgi:hypothetical protein